MSISKIPHQEHCLQTWADKHALHDAEGNRLDADLHAAYKRVAKALSMAEKPKDRAVWEKKFYEAMCMGAVPGGRILSNAGAEDHKNAVSLINCVVSDTIEDSIESIMQRQKDAVLTLKSGCGIGYEFSTLRYKGAFVKGAGASTSGPLSFMDGYDRYCDTISSAGGRRGAQMATFDISHPDVVDFILAKRNGDRFSKFNLSVLITEEFLEAVRHDEVWEYKWQGKPTGASIPAKELWDLIMRSTYEYAEPGFLMIDVINRMNNLWFCENIRATNPCGEQPLPPNGACLLGSINLVHFVRNPFTPYAEFDVEMFEGVVRIFNRMLDNVVEMSGLPLAAQDAELRAKRRHGMGYMGLGSALAMLGIRYGSKDAVAFTDSLTYNMALWSYDEGAHLAKEKGMAPVLEQKHIAPFDRNGLKKGKSYRGVDLFLASEYMLQFKSTTEGKRMLASIDKHGCRYTHAISIAPTGTIAFGVGNNCSSGIEPSFGHVHLRNRLIEGKATKDQVEVYSFEALAYKHWVESNKEIFNIKELPDYFATANTVTPREHIDMQAASQKWVDSSISKTINVPKEFPFEDFKDLYMYAAQKGLKGCTTYRPNPEKIGTVLTTREEQDSRTYEFTLADGSKITARGSEKIMYKGEEHIAAILYEAIRVGTFGKY